MKDSYLDIPEPITAELIDTYDGEIYNDIHKDDKTFNVFVGFVNKATNSSYSVKKARQINELVELYSGIKDLLHNMTESLQSDENTKSTKRKSYEKVDIGQLDQDVYMWMYNHPGSSRAMIANGMNRRLSSVCGAVNRLMAMSAVSVSGKIFDHETNREVETVDVIKY